MKLAIDSSQTSGSIAIHDGVRLVYSAFFDIRITHSETLMPVLDAAMKLCGYRPQDINELYICLGPGSFTGLRIGLATAKGIAYAQDIPVLGFSSLELAALPFTISGKKIISVIDAKMQEVYAAGFDVDLSSTILPCVTTPKEILNWDTNGYVFCGSGVPRISEIASSSDITLDYAPPYYHQLKAEYLFELSRYIAPRVHQGDALADLEPFYIRESTAQMRKR